MALLYPRHTDADMQPIIEGLGRVMLSSGRAWYAVRNIAYYRMDEDEAKTAKFMINITASNIANEIAKLFANSGSAIDEMMAITDVCERYATLYNQRNRLVHDEWWVWPGAAPGLMPNAADRRLVLREVDRKTGVDSHDENWTAERLDTLAAEMDTVADELDVFGYKSAFAAVLNGTLGL